MPSTNSTPHIFPRLLFLALAATAAILLVGGAVAARRQRAELVAGQPSASEAPRTPLEQKFPRELVS